MEGQAAIPQLNPAWSVSGAGPRAEARPAAWLMAALVLGSACGFIAIGMPHAAASQTAPAPAPEDSAQRAAYHVIPGDVLEITVYAGAVKQDQLNATISGAGLITCPLVGDVRVAGLTPAEIATQLRESLAQKFFVDPQVIVNVHEYVGKIYISGEVQHPGVNAIQDRLTVLNACILAGGFTKFASPGRATVTRVKDGASRVLRVDLNKVKQGKLADLVLQPGDRIDVPARRF